MRGDAARGQHPASDVLAELRVAPHPVRISELAEKLGIHPNTVRFHLNGLLERGQVESVEAPPDGPGRPARLFRAVPRMDPSGPRHYRLLAELLLADLAADPRSAAWAVDAGRAWGAGLGAELEPVGPTDGSQNMVRSADAAGPGGSELATQRLVELMEDLGFAPDQLSSSDQISLRHCPFLELAQKHPEVVCQLHLGMAQGILAAWQVPLTAARVRPFAEPDRCVVELRHVETPH